MHQLSPDQQKAVFSTANALVVTAGAGSGKTEVIAQRVERLLSSTPDETFRVLALSYTVKAADELESRLAERLGDVRRVDADTIHAFAHRLIRQHGTWEGLPSEPEVLDRDEDRVELLVTWLAGLGTWLDEAQARSVLSEIDLARARLQPAPHLDEYREALAERGALDYPAMLEVGSRLLERDWLQRQVTELYHHVVIDEAQNLTAAQYKLISALLGEPPSGTAAMLVGDEKQSIVRFAGADPALIGRFEAEYGAERIELTENFRSAKTIVELGARIAAGLGEKARPQSVAAASGLIELSVASDEPDEGIQTARWIERLLADGILPSVLAPGESSVVRPEDIAVLARTAAMLQATAAALDDLGIGYVVASGPRDWVSSRLGRAVVDLIAFRAAPNHPSVRAHLSESCQVAVEKLDNLTDSPVPGLSRIASASGSSDDPIDLFGVLSASDADVGDELSDTGWGQDRALLEVTWSRYLDRTAPPDRTYPNLQLHISRSQRGELSAPGVRLLTVHKSQGREFRAVSVIGLNQGQFPDWRQRTPEEQRSELHCFYVSVSRASRVVRLSRARIRSTRNGYQSAEPSEYLKFATQ